MKFYHVLAEKKALNIGIGGDNIVHTFGSNTSHAFGKQSPPSQLQVLSKVGSFLH